jgi:hypothetical protein
MRAHTVNRISIVKPERARAVEELIIRMARTGQIRGKLTEPQMIELLEGLKESEAPSEPKIVLVRVLYAGNVLIASFLAEPTPRRRRYGRRGISQHDQVELC